MLLAPPRSESKFFKMPALFDVLDPSNAVSALGSAPAVALPPELGALMSSVVRDSIVSLPDGVPWLRALTPPVTAAGAKPDDALFARAVSLTKSGGLGIGLWHALQAAGLGGEMVLLTQGAENVPEAAVRQLVAKSSTGVVLVERQLKRELLQAFNMHVIDDQEELNASIALLRFDSVSKGPFLDAVKELTRLGIEGAGPPRKIDAEGRAFSETLTGIVDSLFATCVLHTARSRAAPATTLLTRAPPHTVSSPLQALPASTQHQQSPRRVRRPAAATDGGCARRA